MIVSNRGSLTKEAQEAMGAKNWSSAMDIAATKDPKKIKDKLGSVSGNTVYDVLKSIMANENDLDEVFKKKVGKINSIKDSVVLQFLSNDWTSLAKTSSRGKQQKTRTQKKRGGFIRDGSRFQSRMHEQCSLLPIDV